MRIYEVQPGDTPASIAAQDSMAGCPKCAADIVKSNPHKKTVTLPNGYVTFADLRAGEKLNIPDKWTSKEFDGRPPTYFAALPHYDGVTPSKLGLAAAGVLGDFTALDTATTAINALSVLSDQSFSNAVIGAATLIDQSVSAADGSPNPGIAAYAAAVHIATNAARQRNADLVAAINSGNQAAATAARTDIQNDFLTAIDSAGLALHAVYGGSVPTTPTVPAAPTTLPAITAAAQAAVAAILADPNFCASVAQPGSAVNAAVHAFKTAWNAANPANPVPINTGNYEQATVDVLTRVLGTAAPIACAPHAAPVAPPPPFSSVTPPQQQSSQGLSTGAIVGLGLLGAGVVGGVIYLATNTPSPVARARRPARPFHYDPDGYHDDTSTEEE